MIYTGIGILGYGTRGRELAAHFHKPDNDVFVTAVADILPIESLVKEGEGPVDNYAYCRSVQELCEHLNVDAVVIATPDYLHEEHALLALNAGKHVYLEKPMAITPEGCDRIIAAAKKNNRIVYVGHNLRHFTVIKKLKEVVDSGAIGEVKAVWCRHPVSYGRWAYFKEGRWHKKREAVGGLLIHKGSHDLDVIHWLGGGHSTCVVAMGQLAVWHDQPGEPDVEDMSSVLMQLDNGVQATYSQCHFSYLAFREYMIMGTKGTLRNVGDDPASATVQLFATRKMNVFNQVTEEWTFEKEQGFHGDADKRIAEEFIGILRGTTKPTISIEDAAWAVKAGYAATVSLRNGNIAVYIR